MKFQVSIELKVTTNKDYERVFYKYLISKLTKSNTIPTLTDTLGNTHVCDRDKANALNAYFVSTFTRDNGFLLFLILNQGQILFQKFRCYIFGLRS